MANILVTGGAGFVGSNLVNRLLHENHEVSIVDNFSNGLRTNVPNQAKLYEYDLGDKAWISSMANTKFDIVIHCAAQSSNATSFKNPHRDLNDNLLSTLNIIEFCNAMSIKRIIFTSSMSVYGNTSNFPTKSSTSPLPETFYALHKATSEKYFHYNPHLNWTIFRLYTTYGAGQNLANREQGLVKIFLKYILDNEPVQIHGSGERIRDIIHVNDVVEAIVLSLNNQVTFGKTYNLGTGQTILVSEIIAQIYSNLGIQDPLPSIYGSPDIGDPFKTHADISDINLDLNWKPRITPEQGISLTTSNYLPNRKNSM